MKKKLYIICASQFGYLNDTYYYCKLLKDDYNITYICVDNHMPKITETGIEVIYLELYKKGLLKWLEFVKKSKQYLNNYNGLVLVKYFPLCTLLRSKIQRHDFILDIRTGSINPKAYRRRIFNTILYLESRLVTKVNIISKSLAKLLRIKNYNIIPLGAPEFTSDDKTFDTFRLFYVGTLSSRNIIHTLYGLKEFIDINPEHFIESYDVVGDGYGSEVEEMKKLCVTLGLEKLVTIHGRVPHDRLTPFLISCNIGISYIPITKYFDVQPVTKTLEYIANGMFVIGTATTEQKEVINDNNGILCEDNQSAFADALLQVHQVRSEINSKKIRLHTTTISWKEVAEQLKSVLNK